MKPGMTWTQRAISATESKPTKEPGRNTQMLSSLPASWTPATHLKTEKQLPGGEKEGQASFDMRFKMVPTTVILRQGVVVGSLFLAMLFRMIVRNILHAANKHLQSDGSE